ncbi:heterokaryon incompatibility protein [Fusarium phyllophilum]|uniref:Heterokaryon incompatibility protein n=1 Tax=Fusarium phyllophilum TaxID=47803 RepID=A0A8H5MY15_9HYPO|nr:heterokaryon incompatibility protein [Fusarium phyllophilum]
MDNNLSSDDGPTVIQSMKQWLSTCDRRHIGTCDKPCSVQSTQQKTSWLIDVKDRCLVRGNSSAEYLALSYTWRNKTSEMVSGAELQLLRTNIDMLTSANALDQHKSNIPKVILDAMELTDAIGKRHLWVDRLCIIQDDPQKASEVASMDRVYSGACLTIIAAADYGMLSTPEQTIYSPKFTPPPTIVPIPSYRNAGGTYNTNKEDCIRSYYAEVSLSEWSKRAWTYQEYILSKRAVFFLNTRIFWQCECALWDSQVLRPEEGDHSRAKMLLDLATMRQFLVPTSPDFGMYVDLICPYNGRELPYEEDGLSACQGILSRLAPAFPGGFLFGLPRLYLDYALLWQPLKSNCYKSGHSARRPSLPSWAWCGWQCFVDPESLEPGLNIDQNRRDRETSETWKLQDAVIWELHGESPERPASASNLISAQVSRAFFLPAVTLEIRKMRFRSVPDSASLKASKNPFLTKTYLHEMPNVVVLQNSKEKGLWPFKNRDANGMYFNAAYNSAGRWVISDDQEDFDGTYVVCTKGDYKKHLKLVEYKDGQEYQFYNVLWVQRGDNNVAYRAGCGRVLAEAWEGNNPENSSTTSHSAIPGQPEAALLESSFFSLPSVFGTPAMDGSYAVSPNHGGDGWIDGAFGDIMPELMSFGLIPNGTTTSIQTPELLQMADDFGSVSDTVGLSPKDSLHHEGEISASPIASLPIDTNRPQPALSQPVRIADTPQPYNSTVVDRPLNDYSTILVEYYFKETAAILALYDSEMNPFRSTVSRAWASSELIYCTLQSMAASYLSNVYPQLLNTGRYFRQKAIGLLNDLDDSAIHEQALIALFMIGGTASWFDVNDTGSEYFPRLKRHVQSLKTSGRMSPTGHSQAFFENTLACWEMFLAFVVDGDEAEGFDSPHLPLLLADQDPEAGSIFPVVQIPHPVTGVAHEVHTTLARVGRLVRRNRRRAISRQFLTRESILEAHREVDEAAELDVFLTNFQVPLESAIVQTGDSQTPTWHLTALAEVYRFVGLIQLYHVFPDTLISRANIQNSNHGAEAAAVSAHEAEERLRQFTLKAVEILRSIPAESGTKDFHPFLIVAVCSGLTIPVVEVSASPQSMAGLGNSLALVAADVHRARGFLRGRLQLLLHSLPKNPIQRCIDIVEATWAETDNRHGSSGRPAYWMDVMMQNNWETFMA